MAADATPALVLGCAVKERREDSFLPLNVRRDGDFKWRPPASLVEMEADAALVLANFAQIAFLETESSGERAISASDAGSDKGPELGLLVGDADSTPKTSFSPRRAMKSKSTEDEGDRDKTIELERASISQSRRHLSCGIRGKQEISEDEKEAKRMRRVLANRESARQTIFRRQARFEELSKRAAELSLENEHIRTEKVRLAEELSSLKDANARLKEQVAALTSPNREENLFKSEISTSVKSVWPICSSATNASNGVFPLLASTELEISKLFGFNCGGPCSAAGSGVPAHMFPWLFPVCYSVLPWPGDSATASCRGEWPIDRALLTSESKGDLSKDEARIPRSETAASEARKKRKGLSRRVRRC